MKSIIGLDIGGTKIAGIVYDGKTVLRRLTVPTPKDLEGFEKSILKLLGLLSSGKTIGGIGVGMAGVISPNTGQIVYSPNMKFLLGFNPEKFFKGKKLKNVRVENDANCFALAESLLGKGKEFKNFVGLTLGTGIGGGIVINKKLYTGANGAAGETGHLMADFKYDSEHYYQMARDKKDYEKLGEVVGLLLSNLINFLDIEAVILGGSVAITKADLFLPHALGAVRKHIISRPIFPKIIVSTLKDSGSLGAALLLKE